MIWALKDNQKIRAMPNLKAECPICKNQVISKCGKIKVWHFAHKSNFECDKWAEHESQWHINWKQNFPFECQEVTVKKDFCFHRADIKINNLVIELQNSPISPEEIIEREKFYENMIWILSPSKREVET